MKGNKRKLAGMAVAAVALLALAYTVGKKEPAAPTLSLAGIFQSESPDHLTGRFTTIVDEQGNVLSMMARTAFSGDELYTAEGRHYRINRVVGDRAEAGFLGMDENILSYTKLYAGLEKPALTSVAEKKPGSFAVYHTHSDESYVPSDGTAAIPFKGGIYQVGKSIVDRLESKGMAVNYDQTPHDPHDNNAYTRSRRTAVNLMKMNPVAIFDVHRDGIPDPSYYRADIDGKDVAKMRLVVGRENPRMSANMDFAKQMMAAVNDLHPKVVKEIFVGKGDYNQDLSPTALLIEAGTHTNSKEEAERGVDMFAEALPTVMGLSPATPAPFGKTAPGKSAGATKGSWKALGWILGLTVVGGLAFLLISSGGTANAKKRLGGFGRELFPFFPRGSARKPWGRSGKDDESGE